MKPSPAILRGALALAGLALVAACNSSSKKTDAPAKLEDFKPTAHVQKVWSASVGGGEPKLRLGLGVALEGDRVFAAGNNGNIAAFDLKTGKRLWVTDTKLPLTGGPGAGAGLVVAGASRGDLVAVDSATGARKWRSHINSEILSAPVISAQHVLLRTVDGRVSSFSTADGKLEWSAEQQVPRLSLRGAGVPAFTADAVIAGFDNGRIMALQQRNGDILWETTVSPPSGRSELDRLVDIDSAVKAVGNDIYAVTFQGKVARVDLETGQVQWSRDMSSYSGIALDDDGLYVSSAQGSVVKIGRRTGVEMWKVDSLHNRRLSPPGVVGNLVAVADLKGIVHFFDTTTGTLAARVKSS
ncbi:MAG TPA: outer membrane protein assembly factor BamB, partial [Steroidobacteraceae bacterium]|nr:outer membrane protein assembly factor BamB [Steroidobacteraceae bacterium]